jgi:anthranilate phosphoribosyltransferase
MPPSHSWPEVLTSLIGGADLSADEAGWAMGEILAGAATPVQIAGFAVALRGKGETTEELSGLVDAMYAHAVPLELEGRWLDVVGTGGDRSMSVNISTMASIVAAGAGARVVKHGNRSASSKSGAADVLEALGVRLDLTPGQVDELGRRTGLTFCFAPAFHPALRHAAVARRELAVGTTFNFLGPLANPARPSAQAIGCADARMAPLMAGVYARRGVDAWVFRGDDGLDELTTTTTSRVWAVHDGEVTTFSVSPEDVRMPRGTAEGLRGGDAAHNADVVRRVMAGEEGPVRDAVLLNAGAALAVYDAEGGDPLERLRAGVARATGAVDSGAARQALERWVEASSSFPRG